MHTTRICRVKCATCGRLLGTYIHSYITDYFLPGLFEDDACNMGVEALSSLTIDGKIRKIYCTDRPCKPSMPSSISIKEEEIMNTNTKLTKKDIIDITEQAYENMCAKYPDKKDKYLEAKEIAIKLLEGVEQ